MENLEGIVANLKQELSMAKKRVNELQHALEDDMHYDSEGMSDDGDLDFSDDSDYLKESSSRRSEPRSYRSFDELDDGDDLTDGLKRKLNNLTELDDQPRSADSVDDADVFDNSYRRQNEDGAVIGTRRGSEEKGHHRRHRSGTDESDAGFEKRRRKSHDKKRKSLEKSRSFEKCSKDNSVQ